MIEFFTNHHGVSIIEKVCRELVRDEIAICVKDSREGDFELGRYIKDKEMLKDLKEDRSFGVVVYNNFVIRIDSGDKFNPHTAVVRIWINKNNHSAGFKISEQDLIAIIQTVSVTKYLRQLDISLGGDKNGVLPLEKVAMALTQAINKVAPDAHTAFTAQKINRR